MIWCILLELVTESAMKEYRCNHKAAQYPCRGHEMSYTPPQTDTGHHFPCPQYISLQDVCFYVHVATCIYHVNIACNITCILFVATLGPGTGWPLLAGTEAATGVPVASAQENRACIRPYVSSFLVPGGVSRALTLSSLEIKAALASAEGKFTSKVNRTRFLPISAIVGSKLRAQTTLRVCWRR